MVGLGSIAGRVAPAIALAEDAELLAVCSRDPEKAAQFARSHGAVRSYSSYDAFLGDPELEAVYIATPNVLHPSQTLVALYAGKHVLVEKPMALTVKEAQQMVEVASRLDRRLGVGFHLRHHPVHRELRRSLAAGEVEEIAYLQALWGSDSIQFPRHLWQMDPRMAGSGSIMGLGVHLIDLLRWLAGREIVEVTAFADGPTDQFPVEFLTMSLLRFDNGLLGQFTSSRRLPNGANSVTVYGTDGRYDGQATLSVETTGQLCLTRGCETTVKQLPLRNAFALEIEAFCRAIREGVAFEASGEDGVRSVDVTVAVLESARSGRAVAVP
jgi:1,5-anhydro-D-fructose reductase (1,5-anhydro-D-mannitol-forming)